MADKWKSQARSSAELELLTDHLLPDLRRRSIAGGAVTFGAQFVKSGVQIVAVVILARLMSPSIFGLFAMIGALSIILDVIKDFGLSAATIQKTDITQSQVSALFCLNLGICTVIALGLFFGAPLLAQFYHQPELDDIARALSFTFVLSGLTAQHWAMLRRQMRFSAIAIMDVGAEITGMLVAVVLAYAGFGFWALVGQRLAAGIFASAIAWSLCRWRPSWPSDWTGVRGLVGYGAAVAGSGLLSALVRSVDQIAIGWIWGAHALGLYERSTRLAMVPINNLNGPLYAVAMPALCRLAESGERYRRMFCALMERLAMVVMPGGILIVLTADWLVEILFGPQWSEAAPLVACFGVFVSCQPVILVCVLLLLSQNRPKEMMHWSVVDAAASLLCIGVGLSHGALGVAFALAVGAALVRMPVAFHMTTREGPVRAGDLVLAVLPSSLASAGTAAAIWAVRLGIGTPATPWQGMLLAIIAWLAACLAVFALIPQSRRALIGSFELPALLLGARESPGA